LSLFQIVPTSHSSKLCILSFQNKTTINKTTNMKTLLLTIALTFSLLASTQVPQTALNCKDDKEGVKIGKLFDSKGVPWNLSALKDVPHLDGLPYTGIVKSCNSSTGKIVSKKSYVSGILEGLSYKYNKNGLLSFKKKYDSGVLHGGVIHYYADGTTKSKENYASGKLDGEVVKYHENGVQKSLENYSSGNQDGTQKFFFSNGKVMELYFCNSDGNKEGLHKSYYKKGTKKFVESYSDGNMEGKQKYYDKKERTIEEKTIESGVQISGYKLYDLGGFSMFVWFENLDKMDYATAVNKCKELGDGWRLPFSSELYSLFGNRNTIDGISNGRYWSLDSMIAGSDYMDVSELNGDTFLTVKVYSNAELIFRPVKTFKP
jgi:antitoxin component YwqK of YwqJK toxin-antitoxin module